MSIIEDKFLRTEATVAEIRSLFATVSYLAPFSNMDGLFMFGGPTLEEFSEY